MRAGRGGASERRLKHTAVLQDTNQHRKAVMLMEIPMNRAKARNEAPRLREVACSRLRKLEQSLFVKKTDPQACLWIRIARRDQDPHREKSSFHKTSLFQKEIGRLTAFGPFF